MRTRSGWLAFLLAAGMALAPRIGWAQVGGDMPPADPPMPLPLSNHLDRGGLFGAIEFTLLRQTRPIGHQLVAARGAIDSDGQVTGRPGLFLGSGRPALWTDDLGPLTYAPGISAVIGYRFRNGFEMEVDWWHTFTARYAGGATLVPYNFLSGGDLADTFLTASVYNFTPEFGGPMFKTPSLPAVNAPAGLAVPGQFYGVWNAADVMSIQFSQRFDQYDLMARIPIFQTESDRCYGLFGGRFAWIWERFWWRTVDSGFKVDTPAFPTVRVDPFTGQILRTGTTVSTSRLIGDNGGDNVAIYTNIVSNRMYGPFIGIGNEYYLGHGFSISLDLKAAILLDIVKERAKYERADFASEAKRSRTEYTVVPQLQAQLNIWWYPIEGVQVRAGYNVMRFFNTIESDKPIAFNFGGLDPPWEHRFLRFFDGINAGIGFIF